MNTRPLIGVTQPEEPRPAPSGPVREAVDRRDELATRLPAWDLLPADTLLVRRRPLR